MLCLLDLAFKRRRARLFLIRLTIGRITEGTLGRLSSAVANHARRRVGGGVSINFIKLAAVSIAQTVPQNYFGFWILDFGLGKSINTGV